MTAPRPSDDAPGARGVLALVLLLALGLRLASAWTASLHLDDFHSLHHARSAGIGELLRGLRLDNHPPLSFALLRGVRALLGEGELALRLPAVLAGVALVAYAWRLAGRLAPPGRDGLAVRATAAGLVAVSSLALEGSSDLRMYALLALAVAGTCDAAVALLGGAGRPLAVCLWSWVGLHTHYHFVHALLVLGLGSAAAAWLEPAARRRLVPLGLAVALAVALSLPWYLWGFRAQLAHDLAPGGSSVSLLRLAESFAHLGVHETRVAPAALAPLLLGAGALGALLAGLGWLAAARAGGALAPLSALLPVGAVAFLLPAWSALAALLVPRAGYEWRYVAGALAPFAACFALGACAPGRAAVARRAGGALVVAAALATSLWHVRDPGREDYEGAVRWVLARAAPRDAVLAADWQPRLFPHGGAWRYYAPRLAPERELPLSLEHTDDFSLADPAALERIPRVFAVLRSIPDGVALLRVLRERYAREEKRLFGEAIWVLVFEEPVPLKGG